jgi:trk system potassium uptake protein TrkA
VVDEVPLGEDLVITELRPPPAFVGRSLADLALPKRYQLTVVAIRPEGESSVTLPRPDAELRPHDTLVVVAPTGAVARLMERLG